MAILEFDSKDARGTDGTDPALVDVIYRVRTRRVRVPMNTLSEVADYTDTTDDAVRLAVLAAMGYPDPAAALQRIKNLIAARNNAKDIDLESIDLGGLTPFQAQVVRVLRWVKWELYDIDDMV